MGLSDYNKKRDFSKSTEPKGKVSKSSKKLKFVVQFHVSRKIHYDFRLEWRGVLLSFAVPKGLSFNPKDKRLAVHVEDHPLDYVNFEGTIPSGNYGAGTVEIFDKGTYIPSFDFDYGLKKGHLKFVLCGKKFKGKWSLVKIDEKNWLIIKSEDEFALHSDFDKSILPFEECEPQLATLSSEIPKGKEWIFEIKYDGFRILSFKENGKVKCLTRNGINYSDKLNEIVASLLKIEAQSFVVDGEVVAFDELGKSDFGLLREKLRLGESDIFYVIFDLLALDGENLRELPLKIRKEKLKKLLLKCRKNLIYCEHIVGNGEKCLSFAKSNNLEGIVAKKLNSKYLGKRCEDWLKIKCFLRQEFVVIGFTLTEKNKDLSSMLLGFYENNKIVYVGKVGTGFNENERRELSEKLKQIQISKPNIDLPKNLKNEKICWCKPEIVAEIQYFELTKDGLLRQPSFLGIREDKNPKDVVLEVKVEK